MKKAIATSVMIALVLSLVGCGQSISGADDEKPEEMVSGVEIEKPEMTDISEYNVAVTDFAVRLLQSSFSEEENILVSPVSVLSGLSLVANGAKGNSLAQIEEVVGLSAKELNEYMYSYTAYLSEIADEYNKLYLANTLWINQDKKITVSNEFLQSNEIWHNAAIFNTPFDQKCAEYTNDWISDQTQGLVSDMMDEVPEDSVTYLANSLVFDGVWMTSRGRGGYCYFKSIDGTEKYVDNIMRSRDDFYLEDEHVTGFGKYFEDSTYAFVSLLPNEDTDIDTYIQSLTGEKLQDLLYKSQKMDVDTRMPAFSFSYEVDMKNALMEMGIEDIFDENLANLSGIGQVPEGERLQIDQFLYKTCIDVDENGMNTKLIATDVEVMATYQTLYIVDIERPFVIILLDCENNIPLLIGTVMNISIEDPFSEAVLQSALFDENKVQKCENLSDGIDATGLLIKNNSLKMNNSEDDLFVDNCVIVKSTQEIAFDTSKVIAAVHYIDIYDDTYYIQYETVEAAKEAVEILEQYPTVVYAVTDSVVSLDD